MATVVLDNTSSSPWMPPGDCPAGTVLTIENWGSGSGASGGSTSFRAGGSGGGYAYTQYTVTSSDVSSGIAFSISAGSSGTAAANPTAGPDTTFGTAPKNLVPNSNFVGASSSPSTLPLGWATQNTTGLNPTVVGTGVDGTSGLNYVDISFNGNTSGTSFVILFGQNNSAGSESNCLPVSPSLSYTASVWISATNQTNITGCFYQIDWATSAQAFASTSNIISGMAPTTTPVRKSGTATSAATAAMADLRLLFTVAAAGTAVNFTVRLSGPYLAQEASFSSFQATPTSYVLAKGGPPPSGTTGGTASAPGNSFGFASFAGGNGATRTQGGGGGGAAGKDGAGGSATTATGGTGDNTHGGAANTDNVEGGGGGTASTSGHIGGAPGGGGGANTSTGSGGTGGRGQVRLTYTPFVAPTGFLPIRRRLSLLAR